MLTKSRLWLGLGLTLAACGDILGLSNVPRPSICAGVTCALGDLCANGDCYPRDCEGVTCAEGAVCKDGMCIAAACIGTSCVDGTSCAGGACLPTSCATKGCPDAGSVCMDGSCVDQLCVGVRCEAGQVCTGGLCARCSPSDCDSRPECRGKACDDGDACTTDDVCTPEGTCEGTAVVCDSPADPQCSADRYCDGETGSCVYVPLPAESPCNDGDACTDSDACNGAGHCVATPNDCSTPPDAKCATGPGVCRSGNCVFPSKAKGTPCEDGNTCTNPDACDGAGQCVSGAGKICDSPPNGQCWNAQGSCDGTGGCAYTPKLAGTACNADGKKCTAGDHCDGKGNCVVGAAVVCNSPPTCRTSGVCDINTGKCVYPVAANGSACPDDKNPCTTDLCSAGVCVHAAVKTGTARTGCAGRCCGGRCSNLRETANCGACGAACGNGSTCGPSANKNYYACTCTGANYSDAFCNKIYGGSATCYPPGSGAKCNCQNSCPNGAVCNNDITGVNYCYYK